MKRECGATGEICPTLGLESVFGTVAKQSLGLEVVYIGDPMCSWCWGAAPVVDGLSDYCTANDIAFSIVTGGFRPGGDVLWDSQFKVFLYDHWQKVSALTGQPHSDALLKRDYFDYDTEPACRAVVTARHLLVSDVNSKVLSRFFAAIQRKFYVDGEDPKEPAFYSDICATCGLDYETFLDGFGSIAAKERTLDDFRKTLEWGIRGFPSFMLWHGGRQQTVAAGFVPLAEMTSRIERILETGDKA